MGDREDLPVWGLDLPDGKAIAVKCALNEHIEAVKELQGEISSFRSVVDRGAADAVVPVVAAGYSTSVRP